MSNGSTRGGWDAAVAAAMLVIAAPQPGCIAEIRATPGSDGRATASGPDGAVDGGGAAALDAPRIPAVRLDAYVITDVAVGTGVGDPGTGDAAPTCAMQSVVAERLPLDLYVMMDSSGSMTDLTAVGATKWDAVKAAMISFLNDPQSTGIGVGMQYFPQLRPNVPAECLSEAACNNFGPCFRLRTCAGAPAGSIVSCNASSDCGGNQACVLLGACSISETTCAPAGAVCAGGGGQCLPFTGYCLGRDSCETAPYAMPAVAIAALPAAAPGLVASLNAHELDGLTPTAPALTGAITYAEQHARATPGRKVAVLLVTDGFPSECAPTDIPAIAAIAAAGSRGTPAVPTFVIGVFAPEEAMAATTNLNALAAAGGTGAAVVINTNQNVSVALQAALNQIRTVAVACEFRIPPPSMGVIDFAKVNVRFTNDSGATTTVGYVRNRAGCDSARGGWYYDVDPTTGATPKSIITCEATCSAFRGQAAGRVDIVLGCQTYIIV